MRPRGTTRREARLATHPLEDRSDETHFFLRGWAVSSSSHKILCTLMLALFYDLVTEKDFKIPTQPEKREGKLIEVIAKRKKPVALFVDE